jgi:Fur family peroxide stress response transcriptional regulator
LLCSTETHPDANWIYDKVREDLPHISLGTVYRTLSVLADAGLIQELYCFNAPQTRYDGDISDHYHVICTSCGAIQDVSLDISHELNETVSAKTDYRIDKRRLDFYGICPDCK